MRRARSARCGPSPETLGTNALISSGQNYNTLTSSGTSTLTYSENGNRTVTWGIGSYNTHSYSNTETNSESDSLSEYTSLGIGANGTIAGGTVTSLTTQSDTDSQASYESGTTDDADPEGGVGFGGAITMSSITTSENDSVNKGGQALGALGVITGGGNSFTFIENNSNSLTETANLTSGDIGQNNTASFSEIMLGTETYGSAGIISGGADSFTWVQSAYDNGTINEVGNNGTLGAAYDYYIDTDNGTITGSDTVTTSFGSFTLLDTHWFSAYNEGWTSNSSLISGPPASTVTDENTFSGTTSGTSIELALGETSSAAFWDSEAISLGGIDGHDGRKHRDPRRHVNGGDGHEQGAGLGSGRARHASDAVYWGGDPAGAVGFVDRTPGTGGLGVTDVGIAPLGDRLPPAGKTGWRSSGSLVVISGVAPEFDSGMNDGTDGQELERVENFYTGAEENPTSAQSAPTPRAEQQTSGIGAPGGGPSMGGIMGPSGGNGPTWTPAFNPYSGHGYYNPFAGWSFWPFGGGDQIPDAQGPGADDSSAQGSVIIRYGYAFVHRQNRCGPRRASLSKGPATRNQEPECRYRRRLGWRGHDWSAGG
jgi:hypothetical protein